MCYQFTNDRTTLWVTIIDPSVPEPELLWDSRCRDDKFFDLVPAGEWPKIRVSIQSQGTTAICIDSVVQTIVSELKLALVHTLHLDPATTVC